MCIVNKRTSLSDDSAVPVEDGGGWCVVGGGVGEGDASNVGSGTALPATGTGPP